ncbi:MAG: YhcH/YjgK/YiaL family protein [Thermomicrobiales bacterium]|nr:YhcH/YjgK/YiaL family protein [Thermomicrobiales bacterium]
MIVANLENLKDQVVLTPNMETAINFLLEQGQAAHPAGRLVVDGDNVFVEVQAYDTIAEGEPTFEGHVSYIDIQYVVEGEEIIGWANIDDVNVTTPYDAAKGDFWLGNVPADRVTNVRLKGGQLAVLYPTDGHAPRRAAGASAPIRKLVVKVAI